MLRRIPASLVYAICFCLLGLATMFGFHQQQLQNKSAAHDRQEAIRLGCVAALEGRLDLADTISSTFQAPTPPDPSLPVSVIELIVQSQANQKAFLDRQQEKYLKPIDLCLKAGRESRVVLRDPHGSNITTIVIPPDIQDPNTALPPTTQPPTSSGTAEAESTTTQTTTSSTIETTTTTMPPTTTTTVCLVVIIGIHIC